MKKLTQMTMILALSIVSFLPNKAEAGCWKLCPLGLCFYWGSGRGGECFCDDDGYAICRPDNAG